MDSKDSNDAWKQVMKVQLDHPDQSKEDVVSDDRSDRRFGTVGCVALYRPSEKQKGLPPSASIQWRSSRRTPVPGGLSRTPGSAGRVTYAKRPLHA